MFSIEADPLTDCFVKVVAKYPGTDLPPTPEGTFFTALPAEASTASDLPTGDLVERFLILAASRGSDVDRAVLAAAVAKCEQEPLVTQIMPFHYTIA
jgi:hypothetical protein